MSALAGVALPAKATTYGPGAIPAITISDGSVNDVVGSTVIVLTTTGAAIAITSGSISLDASSLPIFISTSDGAGIVASGTNSSASATGSYVIAAAGSGVDAVRASDGATITLNGGSVTYYKSETSGSQNAALNAIGTGALITTNGTAITADNTLLAAATFTFGVAAQDGGTVIVNGGTVTATSSPVNSDPRAYGVNVGVNGTVTLNDVALTTSGWRGNGVVVEGGIANVNGGSISVSGIYASGLYSTGAAGTSIINATGTSISATGPATGQGVLLESNSGSYDVNTVTANLYNVQIVATSNGVHADAPNRTANIYSSTIQSSEATGVLASGSAVIHLNGGYDPGTGPMGGVAITTTGIAGVGAMAVGPGSLVQSDSWQSTITTSGNDAHGAEATLGGIVSLTNDSITTSGDNAHGAVASLDGQLLLNGVTIETLGANANGVMVDRGSANLANSSISALASSGVHVANGGTAALANTAVNAADYGFQVTGGTDALPNTISMTGGLVASGADAIYADGGIGTVSFDSVAVSNGPLLLEALNASKIAFTANRTALAGDVLADSGSIVDVTLRGSSLAGNMTNGNDVSVDGASRWVMTADSNARTLTNAGSVGFQPATSPGRTLTLNTYTGNGGSLVFNTQLGGDASPTDRMVVTGDTSGTGIINVINVGGMGGLTVNGIELIHVGGASNATFTLAGRLITSGPYEYLLFKGTPFDANGNWYLRDNYAPGVPIVRPEVPVAMVIPSLAIDYGYAMLGTRHERFGDTYVRPLPPVVEERTVWCKDRARGYRCTVRIPATITESQTWFPGAWGRVLGDRVLREPDNFLGRGPNYSYNLWGIQAGLDIFGRELQDGMTDKAGVYVGYGQVSAKVKGQLGGRAGSIDMDAYTLGAYWTHISPSGWYTDAVVQGTWYSADAKSIYGEKIKPDGFGILGSLEGGYTFGLGSGFTLEPQAQIVYQNVSFDHARDAYSYIDFADGDSLRGRLGLRLAKTWNAGDETKPRLITGSLQANVWHEFLGKTKTSFGSLQGYNMVPFSNYLGGTWGELGASVTAQVADGVNIFATGAYQHSLDNKGYEGWNGRLGMRVNW